MPRVRRRFLADPAGVGIYHCINRCVRRAFLCGDDPVSGKNFDHRKQWIQDRIQFLAGQFGVDVLGFAVMSNHIHVVLRNRPDLVAGWSDVEVARRWWFLFPKRRDKEGNPLEPTDCELQMIIANPEKFAEIRARLSSVSWFMRCLVEPIARLGNKEDLTTGRFWQGRFRCVPVLDESALAACLAYVDLNCVRAQIAETPETSRFTSVYERIKARVPDLADLAGGPNGTAPSATITANACNTNVGSGPDWLSPFELSEPAEQAPVPSARASNKGCLPMPFTDYLCLLDWTGRQLRRDKRGAIPSHLAPILERLQIGGEGWMKLVGHFDRLFRRAAGRPSSLQREREQQGCKLMQGIRHSREIFL
jgi:hypothetical protein